MTTNSVFINFIRSCCVVLMHYNLIVHKIVTDKLIINLIMKTEEKSTCVKNITYYNWDEKQIVLKDNKTKRTEVYNIIIM